MNIRGIARIHVEALTSAPESVVGRKRLPIASPYDGNTTKRRCCMYVGDAHPNSVTDL
jgi:hypothetical protein